MASIASTGLRRSFCFIFIILLSSINSSLGRGVKLIFPGDVTSTTISITWFDSAGSTFLEYYTVDIAPASGTSVNGYPVTATERAFECTGLRPQTVYTITVTPWNNETSGESVTMDLTTGEIPESEILVTDVTPDSAFLQWKDYSSAFYTVVTSPTGAVGDVVAIFEPEVELTILMTGTRINVTVGGAGGITFASGSFTSGTPDECSLENPPQRCNRSVGNSASNLRPERAYLIANVFLFLLVYVNMRLH